MEFKKYKEFVNESIEHDLVVSIIYAANAYAEIPEHYADVTYDSLDYLVNTLKSDEIPKKYHKEFDQDVESIKKRYKL
jgi:hypothetical protein